MSDLGEPVTIVELSDFAESVEVVEKPESMENNTRMVITEQGALELVDALITEFEE